MAGYLYLISGPSGIGKTSLIKSAVEKIANLVRAVSFTTRPKRVNEEDGLDYHFVSLEQFTKLKDNGELLNCTEAFGNYYATSKKIIFENLDKGFDVIMDIDPKASKILGALVTNHKRILVTTTQWESLENRLRSRGDAQESIEKRLMVAKEIQNYYSEFDYLLTNNNNQFERAINDLRFIILSNRTTVTSKTSKSLSFDGEQSFMVENFYQNDFVKLLKEKSFKMGATFVFRQISYLTQELENSFSNPVVFLAKQNSLLYQQKNLINEQSFAALMNLNGYQLQPLPYSQEYRVYQISEESNVTPYALETAINNSGLPANSDEYYKTKKFVDSEGKRLSNQPLRILNIASGANPSKKLFAVNVDNAAEGEPDYIAEVDNLSVFPDGYFTLVRASHILEHFSSTQITAVLREWTRVLHPYGEIHIIVPDAKVIIQELKQGKTPKGLPSANMLTTTSTLAQIYGVGYENKDTNPKWRHRILFNYELIKYFLNIIGLKDIQVYASKDDLAYHCGVKDDSQNHYSLLIKARHTLNPHLMVMPNLQLDFHIAVKYFKYETLSSLRIGLSIIIPVRNEESNLDQFLDSLLQVSYSANAIKDREYIFAINGCTDGSKEKIRKFISLHKELPITFIECETGIINAFRAGILARKLQGYIGKIDADVIIHPEAIDRMYMMLCKNINIQATYSDPVATGEENKYNWEAFHPEARSQRLFIHGRASMYRTSPFDLFDFNQFLNSNVLTEDILLSYAYALHYGMNSIKVTPGAIVYYKPQTEKLDKEKKVQRTQKEIQKIESFFPYFKSFSSILKRKNFVSSEPESTSPEQHTLQSDHDEWDRLESSKGHINIKSRM
jgi:guanylate kinase